MKNEKVSLITKPNTTLANKTGAWRTAKPMTDLLTCIGCSLCAKICPEGCIVMGEISESAANGKKLKPKNKKLKPKTDYNYCKGCGLCTHECLVKAIKMIKDY
ncbi:MAG: 4Fe-4S binding protein [Candidatus Falkowbacteria bacterium]|nr:4Fe-4S binding protein [Candidatus Falkowbacteria bacterium]